MAKSVFTKHKLLRYFIFLIIIAAITVGTAIGCYLYFGHNFSATDLSEHKDFDSKLNLGANFTLNDILETEKYTYSWVKSSGVDVDIYALNSEEEYVQTDKILSYSDNDKTFSVVGVSKGKVVFTNSTDSSVNVSIPFQTKFSKSDTELIIKDNFPEFYDDGIVDADELSIITELNLSTTQAYDISDFSLCSNLTRIIVSSPYEAVSLKGLAEIDSNVYFYVTDGLYNDYMHSTTWSSYRGRLFPIVNLEEGNCTLVFEFNNGTMSGMGNDVERFFSSVSKGGTITVADYELTRTGYTFMGWYTSNDHGTTLSTRIYDDYVFDVDTKLYASWVINEYDIVYHDDYATPPLKQHVKYDEVTYISTAVLERTGYTFLGWATTDNATSIEFSAGQAVSKLVVSNGSVFNLYAVWAANSYSIIYDANGGLNSPENQEDIAFDMEVSLGSDIPTRTGHTFLGWSTNKNATVETYSPGQTVKNLVSDAEGKVTLFAIWAANTYTIKYNANGGTGAPTEQTDIAYGTSVTLRTGMPTWYGRVFKGWSQNQKSTTASYAAGGTVSNLVADAGGSVTLYAVWEYAQFRIQYDANGGTNAPSTSSYLTYDSAFKGITSSTPTRTGHTFKGWSTSSSGNIEYTSGQELKVNEVNGLYNGNSYRTLYAVWSTNSYKITVETDEATVSGVTNGASYKYGSTITLSVKYNKSDTKKLFVDGDDKGAKTSYSFTMPAHDVSIKAYSSNSCVASGSLITLADGSVAPVESLSVGDALLVFNHELGKYDVSYIAYIENDGFNYYNTLTLNFENNISVKVMSEHGFFDSTLNEYVMISLENASTYLGHSFFHTTYDGKEYVGKTIKLLSYSIEEEYLDTYSFVTAIHYNHFVNGLLGMAAGIDGLYNIFTLDANMKYDAEAMQRDIELYGLATYEEWSDYITYEEFIAFNGQYVNVSIGKGMTTREQIIKIVTKFLHPEFKG